MRRVLLLIAVAAAFAACDRIVDLTPVTDARAPDAHAVNDGDDSGTGLDGGIGDAGIDDGGGVPDAFVLD